CQATTRPRVRSLVSRGQTRRSEQPARPLELPDCKPKTQSETRIIIFGARFTQIHVPQEQLFTFAVVVSRFVINSLYGRVLVLTGLPSKYNCVSQFLLDADVSPPLSQ
ncbi:hypothetical protein PROFUN_14721, partial [Planoprotostelium fungivorum]